MQKERNRETSPCHCLNPWGAGNSNTACICTHLSTQKGFSRCGRATVGIGIWPGFQTWKSRTLEFSWKRCSWWGTGERATTSQVVLGRGPTIHRQETGIINREQQFQNQHREAKGCLGGAKGSGRFKNCQTHLGAGRGGCKIKPTHPIPKL